jgi:hypothetical protein
MLAQSELGVRRGAPALISSTMALAALLLMACPSGALAAAPTIKSLKPANGALSGGNSVTIKGTNFTGATSVSFGNTTASFAISSATVISAVAPAGIGKVNVSVTTPEGTTLPIAKSEYAYLAVGPPAITKVSPKSAPVSGGGKKFKITGTNFTGATAVSFGGTPATGIKVEKPTLISGFIPKGVAIVDVRVTTPEGESPISSADKFEYTDKLKLGVFKVTPNGGPAAGGTKVLIEGENFVDVQAVDLSGQSVPFNVISEEEVEATSPAGTVGLYNFHVRTYYGTSSDIYCSKTISCSERDLFRITEPTVTSVSPSHGPVAGGTPVTVTGTGFAPHEARNFFFLSISREEGTDVECSSMTTCTFLTPPAGGPGAKFVRVGVESNLKDRQNSEANPEAVFTYE